jgi:hypothetical protein
LSISRPRARLSTKTGFLLACLTLLMASCASQSNPTPSEAAGWEARPTSVDGSILSDVGQVSTPAGSETPDKRELARPYPSLPQGLERIETTQLSPTTGETPTDLLESILEDLSSRLRIDAQKIDIVRSEAVLWPDGSLSCPKAGEYYTQEPVSGYWIILQVEAASYDYRASESGYFFLCEQPLPQNPSDQENK